MQNQFLLDLVKIIFLSLFKRCFLPKMVSSTYLYLNELLSCLSMLDLLHSPNQMQNLSRVALINYTGSHPLVIFFSEVTAHRHINNRLMVFKDRNSYESKSLSLYLMVSRYFLIIALYGHCFQAILVKIRT